MKELLEVTDEDGVVRIDKFLAKKFPEYSRAAIAKLFELHLIKQDGRPLKPGEKVRPGRRVEYDLGPLRAKPEVVTLPVAYEDDDIIVIDKPSGVISHARGRFWQEASVASFIRDRVASDGKNDGKKAHDRAGIVHRLDRATSGIMICAKNEDTLKHLQRQFHDRLVTKKYCAIIAGLPEHLSATIDAPIARNPNDPKKFRVDRDGKAAQTDYSVLMNTNKYALVSLAPKTGRTHQLRVHLTYISHPIVGDDLYGGEPANRLMLHASELTITLADGTRKTFTSTLPGIFAQYVS